MTSDEASVPGRSSLLDRLPPTPGRRASGGCVSRGLPGKGAPSPSFTKSSQFQTHHTLCRTERRDHGQGRWLHVA